jgi:hypothetical protein
MSTPEGKFKKDTRDEFVKLPTTWLHIADALMKKGIPDVMGGLRGRLFGLELKVDTPVTKIQKVTLEYMHQGGAWTGIARKVIEAPRHYHIVLSDRMEQNPLYFTDEHHLVEYIWSQCSCGVYISDQM